MKTIAVSIGDINGIGLEIALKAHHEIKKICKPVYMINKAMLEQGAKILGLEIPYDFKIKECGNIFEIKPSSVSSNSGEFSFDSFLKAVDFTKKGKSAAMVTLPIHKKAWEKAGIKYRGHTEALKDIFKKDAIMMIGCDRMYCSFYTHHIPLKDVAKKIKKKRLTNFLIDFYHAIKEEPIGVLALNPHAGDEGVMGNEEKKIKKAIKKANKKLQKEIFSGPLVPDTAFTAKNREFIKYFVCMYHDQGLCPLKALYFDKSINVSLNLPIIRTSVDHGTAFDIAYKDANPSLLSYINAVKEAIVLSDKQRRFVI